MADDKPKTNGDKIWGIPCTFITSFISQVGVPAAFVFALIYLIGWVIAPPLMDAHMKFIGTTTTTMEMMNDTMESIDQTQKDVGTSVDEIRKIEQRSDIFMGIVHDEHQMQLDKLKDIHEDVKDISRKVEK